MTLDAQLGMYDSCELVLCDALRNCSVRDCIQPPVVLPFAAATKRALVVVAGDFNTAAYSPLYGYMTSGALDISAHNRKALSGRWCTACRWCMTCQLICMTYYNH
jgi:hypothetical protein